jgi:hypothetical protein
LISPNTPVLLIGFNRPQEITTVLDKLRLIGERSIFISIDGPRGLNDNNQVEQVRSIIKDFSKDITCEVVFHEENLGCKNHVITAISWFFQNVDQGVIIEDDCVPSFTFFKYTDDLLRRYKDDSRVGMISGNNHGMSNGVRTHDYFFTRYISIWGWATWRDRWNRFIDFLKLIDAAENKDLINNIKTSMVASLRGVKEADIRYSNMIKAIDGDIDTWDYILSGFFLSTNQLTIVPKNNLISNIGYGDNATHTKNETHKYANLKTFELEGELSHPLFVSIDLEYDLDYSGRKRNGSKRGIVERLMKR